MVIPELQSGRLRFRSFAEADLDPLLEFFTDPVTQAFYGEDFTRGRVWRGMAAYLGHWQLRGFGLWALEDKASGRFAGYCGLWYPEGWDDIEIGYGIHPAFRGRNLAVEAAQRVRAHGFGTLRFKRLVSYIDPANRRSIRVVEKLGARPEGTFMMQDKPHTIYVHTNTDIKGV